MKRWAVNQASRPIVVLTQRNQYQTFQLVTGICFGIDQVHMPQGLVVDAADLDLQALVVEALYDVLL